MRSTLSIVLLSLFWCGLFLALGLVSGLITISFTATWLKNPAGLLYGHLRMSVIPFGCLLVLYFLMIGRIRGKLRQEETKLSELTYLDRLLNSTISAFFGVGVIWTAIGMESALMHSLEGLKGDPGTETALSAWSILDRLVNGGLILALSTTVFGGICGYLLRLLKIVIIGKRWDRFVLGEGCRHGNPS